MTQTNSNFIFLLLPREQFCLIIAPRSISCSSLSCSVFWKAHLCDCITWAPVPSGFQFPLASEGHQQEFKNMGEESHPGIASWLFLLYHDFGSSISCYHYSLFYSCSCLLLPWFVPGWVRVGHHWLPHHHSLLIPLNPPLPV